MNLKKNNNILWKYNKNLADKQKTKEEADSLMMINYLENLLIEAKHKEEA